MAPNLQFILSLLVIGSVSACTDFYMNFTNFKLSGRTLDLGSNKNWTITSWPRWGIHANPARPKLAFWPAKIGTIGLTANWFGDDHYGFPSLFGDSLNEKGLSCSMLTLEDSQYQEKSDDKENVFNGLFCHYVAQTYENVDDLYANMPNVAVWGPDPLNQHFVVRDAKGSSLVIEFVGGKQQLYLDRNDGKTGYGIMTNEPTFDWHLTNIEHYEWKRTLARQAVAIPGNFYPEERFLRVHMVKQGMQQQQLFETTTQFQSAFALTVQVMNTVSVPQGDQYGTDSGDSSGEGNGDHSVWGMVRDHANPALYWRDSNNPTFRRLRLSDMDLTPGASHKSMQLEAGAYFVDVATSMQ